MGRVPCDPEKEHEVLVQRAASLVDIHVDEAAVIRLAGCHHDVIDRGRQVTEELFE